MLHCFFRLNTAILTFVLLLSGCGTPNATQTNLDEKNIVQQDSSEIIAESESTSTSEPTENPIPNNIITETPEATEPGVAQIPRLNFYCPTVFPQNMVIDPLQSTITENGYKLALRDPAGGQ